MDNYDLNHYNIILAPYPYKVSIDNETELAEHWNIQRWCSDQFGSDKHCVTWRHALPGSPSRLHPLFSTWCFVHKGDATVFALTWG